MHDDYIENVLSALDQLIEQARKSHTPNNHLKAMREYWYDILEQVLTGQEPEFIPF